MSGFDAKVAERPSAYCSAVLFIHRFEGIQNLPAQLVVQYQCLLVMKIQQNIVPLFPSFPGCLCLSISGLHTISVIHST